MAIVPMSLVNADAANLPTSIGKKVFRPEPNAAMVKEREDAEAVRRRIQNQYSQ